GLVVDDRRIRGGLRIGFFGGPDRDGGPGRVDRIARRRRWRPRCLHGTVGRHLRHRGHSDRGEGEREQEWSRARWRHAGVIRDGGTIAAYGLTAPSRRSSAAVPERGSSRSKPAPTKPGDTVHTTSTGAAAAHADCQ